MQQRTDRRVEAIAKLVQTGMKMLVRLEKTQQEPAEAQKETDGQIKALLKRSTNGHK